jgi:hypothetical protein
MTARSDAVAMLEWSPTPQSVSSSTSTATYAAAGVGDGLHLLREVDLQPARQLEVMLHLHQVRDTALA